MITHHAIRDQQLRSKIGYVVKRYPRYSETFIVNEILAHEKTGLDVEIFALRAPVDTHFQNGISQVRAPVCYLPSGSVKAAEFWEACHSLQGQFGQTWAALSDATFASAVDVFQALKLAKVVQAKNISHLHAHFATSAATVAQIAARVAGITYSVTMHAKDIFHESVQDDDLARKIGDAAFVITVSDFNRDYLAKNYGGAEKIYRIYNGLDLNVFDFRTKERKPCHLIAVGRLVPKKGFTYLIQACRLLLDRCVHLTCEIIGDGELQSDLQAQIHNLKLDQHVTLTGPLPQSVVKERVAAATVLVAPCIVSSDGNRDGLPTVIAEALALGTPCISTDVTGIPEIICHEETGILVAQGDSDSLATQIERMLCEPQLQRSLASNARYLIEQRFDINRNVEELRNLILQHTTLQSASLTVACPEAL